MAMSVREHLVTRSVDADIDIDADAGRRGGETIGWLLLAALAAAVLNQGGFPAATHWWLAAALAAAVAVAIWSAGSIAVRIPARGRWGTPAIAGAAFAGWAFLDGWLHGAAGSGVRSALLVIACGTVAGLCRRLGTACRARLVTAVLCLGCLTALLAWYGVASHSPAFALPGQGLWRGMGTLGYPNATAALLALLLVTAVPRQARHGSAGTHWPAAMASTVLLIGLGATLSRGGLLAVAAGLLGLAALLGP